MCLVTNLCCSLYRDLDSIIQENQAYLEYIVTNLTNPLGVFKVVRNATSRDWMRNYKTKIQFNECKFLFHVLSRNIILLIDYTSFSLTQQMLVTTKCNNQVRELIHFICKSRNLLSRLHQDIWWKTKMNV